jgi:predicted MFS family arabinose efflux permease
MLSILTSCYILGTSVGYEIGGLLKDIIGLSIDNIFIFQVCFTTLTATLFGIFIKDVYKNNNNSQKNIVVNKSSKTKHNYLIYLLLTSLMILTIGQILINKYLDTYIIHIGFKASILGHYVLITGIFSAVSNLLIIPFIKKIKGNKLGYCLSIFIFISSILVFITFSIKTNILYLLFSTHLIYIIIKGLITPLEQNELSNYINNNNNGKLTGARQTIISIGNVLGPLLGSLVYSKGSPTIFMVASVILLISLIMYIIYFISKRKKHYV